MITDRLVRVIAREQTGSRADLYEDAAQEARIAVWQASTERPNASDAYLAACARNAARGVVQGRAMTGAPRHQGKQDAGDTAQEMPEHHDEPGLALTDYVEGADVREAVLTLEGTQRIPARVMREIVYWKVWHDLSDAETARALGEPWTAHAVGECWRNRIKPQLVTRLADTA